MQTQPVNPAPTWRTIFDRDPMFGPDLILQLCAQAIGLLETRALDAEEDEASKPRRRERRPGSGAGHHYGVVIVGAVLGTASTVVAAYLIYKFGWSK